MGLPKLSNDKPIYELTVPSTNQTVKYRPFLVKEQKSMLVAFESKDTKQILNSILQCIENCVEDINVNKLSTFDVDYIFTKVRSKSVGETSRILMACSECNEENEVSVNLDDVKLTETEIKNNVIKLNNDIAVTMKYPTYVDMLKHQNIFKDDAKEASVIFENIKMCMHSVQTEEENILIKDETEEEIETFVNSLNNIQMQKIMDFVEGLPNLIYEDTFECKKCKKENIVKLQGLNDFF